MSSLFCIKTFAIRAEAGMAQSILEESGIKASVSADDAGGMRPDLGFTSGGVKLFVLEEYAYVSAKLLNELSGESTNEA